MSHNVQITEAERDDKTLSAFTSCSFMFTTHRSVGYIIFDFRLVMLVAVEQWLDMLDVGWKMNWILVHKKKNEFLPIPLHSREWIRIGITLINTKWSTASHLKNRHNSAAIRQVPTDFSLLLLPDLEKRKLPRHLMRGRGSMKNVIRLFLCG